MRDCPLPVSHPDVSNALTYFRNTVLILGWPRHQDAAPYAIARWRYLNICNKRYAALRRRIPAPSCEFVHYSYYSSALITIPPSISPMAVFGASLPLWVNRQWTFCLISGKYTPQYTPLHLASSFGWEPSISVWKRGPRSTVCVVLASRVIKMYNFCRMNCLKFITLPVIPHPPLSGTSLNVMAQEIGSCPPRECRRHQINPIQGH